MAQEDGEGEAAVQRHLQAAVQRLDEAEIAADLQPAQAVIMLDDNADPLEAGPAQAQRPVGGVSTRSTRRQQQAYHPLEV